MNDLAKAKRRWTEKSRVVVRWIHLCLTAPSRCNGQPTGMSESSRRPSPFCSITVPKRGTSIVVLRLMYGRLQCHVSGARRPCLATSAMASNFGPSLIFFCRRPLPFGGSPLEAYSRTSGESNHHWQSVCVVKNDALPTEPRGHRVFLGSR